VGFVTEEASMVTGLEGYTAKPLLTIGETIESKGVFNGLTGAYTPVGLLDGIGGYRLDADTVRVFVNHELRPDRGATYTVNNGLANAEPLELTGARISYFDISTADYSIEDGGLAYNRIYGVDGRLVRDAAQLDTDPSDSDGAAGLNRFCSASLFEADEFGPGIGFADRVYFGPQEDDNGVFWALDVENGDLWAAPALGRGAWENLTSLDTGDPTKVALLLGDDDYPANLLYLYVGEKDGFGDGSFLDRNGLKQGKLFAWVPDVNLDGTAANDINTAEFDRPGQELTGTFVELTSFDASKAGEQGYDQFGWALQQTLRAEAENQGAMFFSRIEDLATNPADGTAATFAATGTDFTGVTRDGVPETSDVFTEVADLTGSVYTAQVDLSDPDAPTAALRILYRGDADAANPANAILRSPDNLDWADNGFIYVQEDEAQVEFGDSATPQEASIVRLDPTKSQGEDGYAVRVGQIDRSAVVPAGTTDSDPDDVGRWETSGIVDVSRLFDQDAGELHLFDVQAHSIGGGVIDESGLAEGGQLLYLTAPGSDLFLA
jgi:glycerophosphoryl diester phosphodiesterase